MFKFNIGRNAATVPLVDTYGEETAETETGKKSGSSKYKNLTIVSS